MDPEVVIIGSDGTEHVFPPGFDPKKAAAIVRDGASPETPQPQTARQQSETDKGAYIAQTLKNIPSDAWAQLKGLAELAGTVYGAGQEFGSDAVSLARDVVGADPQWQKDRPNQGALKALPGILVQHYADYFNDDKRAEMVRDHPVGTVVDIAAAMKGGSALRPKAPGVVAAAAPVGVQLAADAVPFGNTVLRGYEAVRDYMRPAPEAPPPTPPASDLIRTINDPAAFREAVNRRLGPVRAPSPARDIPADTDASMALQALTERLRTQQPRLVSSHEPATPEMTALTERVRSMPTTPTPPPRPQDALVQALIDREINWRTTDAVPINARQTPSIIEPGESQIGLGEQLAQAVKNGDAAEVERLAKALRQRMHIRTRKGN